MSPSRSRPFRFPFPCLATFVPTLLCGLLLHGGGARAEMKREFSRVVTTREEMESATVHGVIHVVLTRHLDATRMVSLSSSGPSPDFQYRSIFEIKPSTDSIQGHCSEQAPPLGEDTNTYLDLKPNQCVIKHDMLLFSHVPKRPARNKEPVAGQLWVSRLYLRVVYTQRLSQNTGTPITAIIGSFHAAGTQLYMEDVTMQGDLAIEGDAVSNSFAMWAEADAKVHLENCVIADMTDVYAPAAYVVGASVSFSKCSIRGCNATSAFGDDKPIENAVILLRESDGYVRVSTSSFEDNTPTGIGTFDGNGTAFVDAAADAECSKNVATQHESASEAFQNLFLSQDDIWLTLLKADAPDPSKAGSGRVSKAAVIVGVVLAVVVSILTATVITFVVWKRKKEAMEARALRQAVMFTPHTG